MKATKFTVCQLIIMTLLLTPSCKDAYDDSELTGRVENLENRVQKLEEQMNSNISSLQAILEALNNNDYVTKVVPITNGEKEIGYTIQLFKRYFYQYLSWTRWSERSRRIYSTNRS
ncbi:hypothetical protein [Bacteroides caecigallinarum]|uniref:hypothetical protein n=1 Tax=Bacteroides caecigallinarum TaxID=1411144 RepID=UPI001EF6CFCF|nr:hypothetical protein [Bacteroides caecigallinarum]